MKKTLIIGFGILICNVSLCQSKTEYLVNVLKKLDDIKTASYYSKSSSSAPGDTLAFITHERYVNMYINPADTFLGASYSTSSIDNLAEFDLCYDGTYSVRFDWENRKVQVDTLTNNRYRRPMAPFFIKAKSLIEYAIENIDNSIVKYNIFHDSIKISFYFHGKIIEFMGLTPFIKESPDKVSRYELWVDKNHIPCKFIRKMPHQTSWEICSKIKTSNDLDHEFHALMKIPVDFAIKGRESRKNTTPELEGKTAADWKLKEIYGDSISLSDLKSKVILIQFTGIGCGPCHASIPFLKQLVIDNKEKDFELICIETWSKNISGIERYKDKNELNYKFLVSKSKIKDKYKIQGVPVFFILDEKRVIKKVIVGYQKGVTGKEIKNTINELI